MASRWACNWSRRRAGRTFYWRWRRNSSRRPAGCPGSVPEVHPTAARLADRLRERGLHIEVRTLSDSARTAALAAAALDVEVGQIVKSLVFLRGDDPVLVLCAGDRRVDAVRLG